MADTKSFKGQKLYLEGSRSGSEVAQSKFDYDEAFNMKYAGEAKYGVTTSASAWYIEELVYDKAYNLECCLTATNKIKFLQSTASITDLGNNQISITFSGSIRTVAECGQVGDELRLKSSLNSIQGNLVSKNLITNTIVIQSPSTVVDEASAIIDQDATYIQLNTADGKNWCKRIWDLRKHYIYE